VESQVSEVERSLEALYGTATLRASGVVHVTAAVRTSDDRLRVIRIGDDAPKSATDFFVLNLCRARCDAILTSAENLRREPRLHHDLQGPSAAALAHYRRFVLGKAAPPLSAILTRSGDLPLTHAVWSDGTPKLVLSPNEPDERVRSALGDKVRFVALPQLDARRACSFLHDEGHALVSIEAGPTTASTLYGDDSVVDELLLSLYEGPGAAPQGGLLPAESVLTSGLTCVADRVREEESGRWRFQRWLTSPT
jgi:riboflavin biosynthesis pyrimidine reductase